MLSTVAFLVTRSSSLASLSLNLPQPSTCHNSSFDHETLLWSSDTEGWSKTAIANVYDVNMPADGPTYAAGVGKDTFPATDDNAMAMPVLRIFKYRTYSDPALPTPSSSSRVARISRAKSSRLLEQSKTSL